MKSVLVVDDNELVRNLIVTILEDAGIEVITAASGVAAIAQVEEKGAAIGCVLQDLSMPGMPGEDVAAALLELDPGLPVIILSVDDATYSSTRLAGLEIAGYIQKPFDTEELVATVRELTR